MGISLLGRIGNVFNDPGNPNPQPQKPVDQNGNMMNAITNAIPKPYTRPDGSTGMEGDGQAGDPKTPYGGSSFAGERPGALDYSYDKDFMFGRDPNYAATQAAGGEALGDAYGKNFTTLANDAMSSGQSAQGTAQGYAGNEWNRGVSDFNASGHATGQELGLAGSIAGDNSAAQAQLQSGLNKSEASNLALARSGRGWGQSSSALGQAVSANAAAGQTATTDAALMRERQQEFATGVYGQAAQQAQAGGLANTQMGMQSSQYGSDAALKGQQLAGQQLQTGAGEEFAGMNAANVAMSGQQQSDLAREGLSEQQYATQSGIGSQNQQQQLERNQQIAGYVGAGIAGAGSVAAAFSDTDAKKDKAEATGFARAMQTLGAGMGAAGARLSPGMGGAFKNLGNSGSMNDPDTYQRDGGPRDQPASNFDPFAKYDQQRAADLRSRQVATGSPYGIRSGPVDPSTMRPATSSATYGAREYGIQNPESPESYLPPAAAPAAPMGASQTWLDNYMAQQGGVTSDTEAKRSKERAAGFAEAMRSVQAEREAFPETSAPTVAPVDTDALDAAQRSQGGPVNDMRPAVGYTYRYKEPNMPGAKPGRVAGPMAQDLEHTVAADAVETAPNGYKMVNAPRLTMHNTVAIGEQQTELEKLKAQLDAMTGKKPAPGRPVARGPRASQVNPRTLTRVPTASYDDGGYTEERVPITGEETNFKVPLGWNPDIDEAAAQQITFPGEDRTHVVYRPGTY